MPLIDASQIYQMTNVGDHIDGTDVYNCNENLLDNAYFVGGGSQLGGYKFPINQIGETTYTTVGQTIDRWDLYGGSVSVEADGVVVTSSPDWGQSIPIERIPAGTYTASVLTASGVLGSYTFTTDETQKFVTIPLANTGVTLNFIDRWTPTKTLFSLKAQGVKLAAAKLEKGAISTLLNDIVPDFRKTLDACQLFYERIKATSKNHTLTIGIGNASALYAPLKIAPKYSTPVVSASAIYCGQASESIIATGLSIFDADNKTGQYSLQVDGTFTANTPYRIILPLTAFVQFVVNF